jgi:hypothetical protein
MKNDKRWLAGIGASTLALAGIGHADLRDRGLTTLDTETGLEWLDVTQTLNVSARDILVDGYGGLIADGWALATVEQIQELFLHAGIPLPHDGLQTQAGFAGADRLIALLGATGSSASGSYIQAFSGTLLVAAPPFPRYTPVVITSLWTVGGADLPGVTVPSSVRSLNIGNYLVRSAGPSTIEVTIDIKPWSLVNPVNPRSRGMTQVAVLGTSSFDVLGIEVSSVRFGPAGAAPVFEEPRYVDVDGDGVLDVLLHFRTQATGIECNQTEALLSAATLEGIRIEGRDHIITVGCGF